MLAVLGVVAANAEKTGQALKFFIFREDCFNKFVNNHDFSDTDCIKFTISKGIGLAIVVGSAIVKLPQILKIVSNGSVEGISAMSYYIEVSATLLI